MEVPYKINIKCKSDGDDQEQITSFHGNETEFIDF